MSFHVFTTIHPMLVSSAMEAGCKCRKFTWASWTRDFETAIKEASNKEDTTNVEK